jgi:hypothetical protein
MRKYLIALVVAGIATTGAVPAFAVKQMNDHFIKLYAGEKADEGFKKLVSEAKCNVCHVYREAKKVRNPYGTALHDLIEKTEFPFAEFKKARTEEELAKFQEQLNAIFKQAAESKSWDENHKTFGDRIKANLLPGGNADGKPE